MISDETNFEDDFSLFVYFLSKINRTEQICQNYFRKKFHKSFKHDFNRNPGNFSRFNCVDNKIRINSSNTHILPTFPYLGYNPITYDTDRFLCKYCNIRYVYKRCLITHIRRKHRKFSSDTEFGFFE